MRPVSAKFLRVVRGSHEARFRARLCAAGQSGVDPVGSTLSILSGSVTADATAQVRSTLDLAVLEPWPSDSDAMLNPYGSEIYVERGIAYGNGAVEYVGLGYHRIETLEQDDVNGGPIRISARDRMAALIDARLLAPRQILSTTTFGDLLAELVGDVYGTAVIEWDDAAVRDGAIGRTVIVEEERWKFLDETVKALGKVWYWDHRGILVVTDPPDASSPVFTVNSGRDGVLVAMSRALSREQVYNGVVATGEAADTATPVRAVALDADPDSPTFWAGDYGQVPRFFASPLLTTTEQAAKAAETLLLKSIGLPYQVDFTAVPNPALEPLDPVLIEYPGGNSEVHVIESLTIGLSASEALSAATRDQTSVVIGDEGSV